MSDENIPIEKRLRTEIKKVTGYDPYSKTRKREVVEARGLYIHLLHKYHKKRPVHIARLMGYNHATILHSIKNFDVYLKYNDRLETELYTMLMYGEYDSIEMLIEYIKLKLQYLNKEDIKKLTDQVREMYEESIILESKELDEEQEYNQIKEEFSNLDISYGEEH